MEVEVVRDQRDRMLDGDDCEGRIEDQIPCSAVRGFATARAWLLRRRKAVIDCHVNATLEVPLSADSRNSTAVS